MKILDIFVNKLTLGNFLMLNIRDVEQGKYYWLTLWIRKNNKQPEPSNSHKIQFSPTFLTLANIK